MNKETKEQRNRETKKHMNRKTKEHMNKNLLTTHYSLPTSKGFTRTPEQRVKKFCTKGATPCLVCGFTLIEAIIALAIFSASIVGLVAVTASGVANTNFAKNKLTASYLAQEGIELVRNMRDTALISGDGWKGVFDVEGTGGSLDFCTSLDGTENCNIDAIDLSTSSCLQGDCSLFYDIDGFYRRTGNTAEKSVFTRTITIQEINTGIEVQVISSVSWRQGGNNKNVTMTETLFNWSQ